MREIHRRVLLLATLLEHLYRVEGKSLCVMKSWLLPALFRETQPDGSLRRQPRLSRNLLKVTVSQPCTNSFVQRCTKGREREGVISHSALRAAAAPDGGGGPSFLPSSLPRTSGTSPSSSRDGPTV